MLHEDFLKMQFVNKTADRGSLFNRTMTGTITIFSSYKRSLKDGSNAFMIGMMSANFEEEPRVPAGAEIISCILSAESFFSSGPDLLTADNTTNDCLKPCAVRLTRLKSARICEAHQI